VGLERPDYQENYYGLNYLNIFDKVILEKCSLLDPITLEGVIRKYKPIEIYNLAAQSSVGASFEDPHETVYFNIQSVLNLLEAIKKINKNIKFYQASSSEIFGNIKDLPIDENSVIHPASPYGVSKATGHWLVSVYRESFNIFACSGIMFNHESYLRGNNFFVKKVIRTALQIKNGQAEDLSVGEIDLKRDFGFAPDYVRAMWLMLQQKTPKDYIICSGQPISLRQIIEYVFDQLHVDKNKIIIDESLFRPNDIKNIYGDNQKSKKELSWEYNKTFFDVLDILIKEEIENSRNG